MEMLPAPRAARILLVPEVVAPEDALDLVRRPFRPALRETSDYQPLRPADPVGFLLDVYV
jgi:hypothetical protein